ncbi:PQQ-binding-like beta-propeller repeat protein, partial [Endozoicomonas acroporae]
MWREVYHYSAESDKGVWPEIFKGYIIYIDYKRQLIIQDGASFHSTAFSEDDLDVDSFGVVDDELFILFKTDKIQKIYKYNNGILEPYFESCLGSFRFLGKNKACCSQNFSHWKEPEHKGAFYYYDLGQNNPIWERQTCNDLYASVLSEQGLFFQNLNANKLYHLDPDTGQTLWEIDLPEGVKTANEPIRVYDNVIAISLEKKVKQRGRRDRRLCFMWGLNPNTGERLWEISHRSLFFFKEPETGLLHNFSSASKAFG